MRPDFGASVAGRKGQRDFLLIMLILLDGLFEELEAGVMKMVFGWA
jgi:hypothetical protein